MLLSGNVIYICIRVVMLVHMIRTRFFAATWVKSCPGMHSSCVIASLSYVLAQLVTLQYQGVAQEPLKGNRCPRNQERKSRLRI